MANVDSINNWDKIQKGVKDTEQNLSLKQYNTAMVKARQTLECMVRCMGERACIVESDLAETIDLLFQGKWISKTTCEHYHKIRMIGNRAVHEGNDNAYEANQAYHLLSQEVYTFANDYNNSRPHRNTATNSRNSSGGRSSSGNRNGNTGRNTATSRSTNRGGSGHGFTSDRGRKRTRPKRRNSSIMDLLRFFVPLALILILVVILIFVFKPDKKKETETTVAPTTTVVETIPPTTAPTEPETTVAVVVYKTSDTLNVRQEPSTNGAKLGVIPSGVTVNYLRKYDDFWSVISYNGQEGYVASQYLTAE